MTTDPITKELLDKYGPKCICCGGLATRVIVQGTRVPWIKFKMGSLQTNVEISNGVRASREEGVVQEEIKRLLRVWVEEVNQSVDLITLSSTDPQFYIGTTPVLGAPLCDTCGDPSLEYQDLELAHLVRGIGPTSEPIRPTRFERITKDESDDS